MPRDLHGQDPVLGYSHGNDPVTGNTQSKVSDLRMASIRIAELALVSAGDDTAKVDRDELRDIVAMLGLEAA